MFVCGKPCTVLSTLQEDGIMEWPLTFETWEAKNSLMEPCLWTFRNENGVIHALCLVHVDDFKLACSNSSYGQYVFDGINNLYGWGTWESRVGADLRSVSQNTRNLPSHRRRDRKSQITPLELSQLRALNGQLIWLVMQCLKTVAGASVTVDGTNTASQSGHHL